jgi:inner membrane protein
MEPITHGLTSIALARAGLNKVSPKGTAILLASGYISDLDWLSLLGGPPMMFDWRRVPGHSLLVCAILAALVAAIFWWFGRGHPKKPIRFVPALVLSAIGVASHLLLDVPNRYGCQLLWPFRGKMYTWATVESVDPFPLALLLLGLLLPALFRLVSEEIGARKENTGARNGAILALILIAAYVGARGVLRERAVDILRTRTYQGEPAIGVEAYPSAFTPFVWRGVIETQNTIEEYDVPVRAGARFDASRGITHFKPDDSPMLEAARETKTVQKYLRSARFPIARVLRLREGYEVTLRDVRFHGDSTNWGGFAARIEMNNNFEVTREEIVSSRLDRRLGPPD